MRSIIVYGPQGTGKTLNAELMKKHFGLAIIQEEFSFESKMDFPKEGHLILTNETPPAEYGDVFSVEQMKSILGEKWQK